MITLIFAILFSLKVAGMTTVSWYIVFLPLVLPLFMSIMVVLLAFTLALLRSK